MQDQHEFEQECDEGLSHMFEGKVHKVETLPQFIRLCVTVVSEKQWLLFDWRGRAPSGILLDMFTASAVVNVIKACPLGMKRRILRKLKDSAPSALTGFCFRVVG